MNGEIKMGVVNEAIENLKRIDVDGETMQYIIEKLGMDDQMLRQLVLTKPRIQTFNMLDEWNVETFWTRNKLTREGKYFK
jgi:hypothetical protein|tara:strand:+ start:1311 stop:1550 length:240 start_codon:yes stop_codon:yes gene_type:complete